MCCYSYDAARQNLQTPSLPSSAASPPPPALPPTRLLPSQSFGFAEGNAAGAGRSVAETRCCVRPHRDEPQEPAELQRWLSGLPPAEPGQGRLGDVLLPQGSASSSQNGPLTDLTKPAGPRGSGIGNAAHGAPGWVMEDALCFWKNVWEAQSALCSDGGSERAQGALESSVTAPNPCQFWCPV